MLLYATFSAVLVIQLFSVFFSHVLTLICHYHYYNLHYFPSLSLSFSLTLCSDIDF